MLNYKAPINKTGYGVAALGYLKGLLKQNVSTCVVPIGAIPTNDQELNSPENKVALSNIREPDYTNTCFVFWHLFDIPNQIKLFSGKKVGFTTFELNSLNPKEQEALHSLDYIGTASKWGADILSKYIDLSKVFIAPHAMKVRETDSLPTITQDHSKNLAVWESLFSPVKFDKDTLILSTAGKFESRKGHPELIQACMEYGEKEPILLVSFFYNPFINGNYPFGFINNKFLQPIFTQSGIKLFKHKNFYLALMPPCPTRDELHGALSKAHYFIAPSKGEGWNLPLFEMMSYGMPCIATTVTAHADYCLPGNHISIANGPLIPAIDNVFFDGKGSWYSVSKDNVLAAIRKGKEAIQNGEIKKIAINAKNTTQSYSWETSAKMILPIIS